MARRCTAAEALALAQRIARGRLPPQDAEDVAQDAVLKLISRGKLGRDSTADESWVSRATRDCVYDWLKQHSRRPVHLLGPADVGAIQPDRADSASRHAMIARAYALVRRRLKERERRVLDLHYRLGLGQRSTARALALQLNQVQVSIRKIQTAAVQARG